MLISMIDLWECTAEEIAQGFRKAGDRWECLLCTEEYTEGYIYETVGRHCEAYRAVQEHVRAAHGSVFLQLLETHGDFAGLTKRQAEILRLMHGGLNDKEIAERTTGSGSTASIRNLRFQLKEREKQAKAYLCLMEAFRTERAKKGEGKMDQTSVHDGATLTDERFVTTERERATVLKTYFSTDGTLREFPAREKRKAIVLTQLSLRFKKGQVYTEKEVNALIGYSDFATIRRYLVEYGYLERTPDCSQYRLREKKDGSD